MASENGPNWDAIVDLIGQEPEYEHDRIHERFIVKVNIALISSGDSSCELKNCGDTLDEACGWMLKWHRQELEDYGSRSSIRRERSVEADRAREIVATVRDLAAFREIIETLTLRVSALEAKPKRAPRKHSLIHNPIETPSIKEQSRLEAEGIRSEKKGDTTNEN